MSAIKKYSFIIGLIVLVSLSFQTKSAFAIYSPNLSKQAAIIGQHIKDAQTKNGKGTVLDAINKVLAYNKKKLSEGRETGIPGEAKLAQKLVFDSTLNFILLYPFDSILMVFNFNSSNQEFISTCLRDDIWVLETLRDQVGAEMIKAYLLFDTIDGAILKNDYIGLVSNISLLRKYGSDPKAPIQTTYSGKMSSNQYFFGTEPDGAGAMNYYIKASPTVGQMGCPNQEFSKAFEQVSNSWKTLKVLASGEGTKWGSIWEMATANASKRAEQWVRANQLSLTLGGKEGGRAESLIQNDGSNQFLGRWKTEWNILKNMIGPVTPLFDLSIYQPPKEVTKAGTSLGKDCVFYYHEDGRFRDCTESQVEQYKKCKKDEAKAIEEDIRCDRFRTFDESTSIVNKLNKQIALQDQHAQTLKEAEKAFTYSMTLDSVGEQNIYFMDEVMWDMNLQIKRGYEAFGDKGGKSITSLATEIGELVAKQCANRRPK